ncbi:hypothetical protein ATDW_23980 [Asticcacaulis sp. DW145]|uniref:hypothetical protein n=1 Tax=Asticcacaulis sp. DW145 TaxID=3095608 RepID=UPI003088FDEF|nr:hypothetical protein ATDW_23980 [Asticcacaulis sp. DW145]
MGLSGIVKTELFVNLAAAHIVTPSPSTTTGNRAQKDLEMASMNFWNAPPRATGISNRATISRLVANAQRPDAVERANVHQPFFGFAKIKPTLSLG